MRGNKGSMSRLLSVNSKEKALDNIFMQEQRETKQDMLLYKCWLSQVIHKPKTIETRVI